MIPYAPEFCVAQSCEHFVHRGLCDLEKCLYNLKRIEYWKRFGHLPGE